MKKPRIYDHNAYEYRLMLNAIGGAQNGAYWYSKEIVENIIPKIKTDRNWVTVNVPGRCFDHSIVFIHNNNCPEKYKWLSNYKDLVLICGVESTVDKIKTVLPMHRVIYLPLSIDTKYVEKFRTKKTKKACFAGRLSKITDDIPTGCDILGNISRDELLARMAEYEVVYAVGRCALEAKCLGCKIGIYDPRYPEDIWNVLDNSEVVSMLQDKLAALSQHGYNRQKEEVIKTGWAVMKGEKDAN